MKYHIPKPFMVRAIILFFAMTLFIGSTPAASEEELYLKKPERAVSVPSRELMKINQMDQDIQISLTYPAGDSPKVFTKGWVFGARCLVGPITRKQTDISADVRWKGTGTFTPDRGPLSRPVFNGPGTNHITLYVERDGRTVSEKTFTVEAVDPKGYASIGSIAHCPNDTHGCPACPHSVKGPIQSGSPNVLIDGKPAARVGDPGIHAACCGSNTFVITTGDPNVLIDGKPAARMGDQTKHCGGAGSIISMQ